MPRDARTIIQRARAELQEPNAADPQGNLWTDAELLNWANDGQAQSCGEILDLDEDFFGDFFEITTVAAVAIYDLPSRFLRMRRFEYIAGGVQVAVTERRPRASDDSRVLASVNDYRQVPEWAYAVFDDQVQLNPTPADAVASAFRAWYVGKPPALTYGTASAGGASTITLQAADSFDTEGRPTGFGANPEDDYYNRSFIRITSGGGAGQRRRIVDYAGDTKIATVSPAWAVVPGATSLYATETRLPGTSDLLLELYAAMCGKGKYKQDAAAIVARFNALHDQISQLFERRTSEERGFEPFDPWDGQ